MSAKKVLFIDRDGTLIVEPPDQQIDNLRKLRVVPGVIPALLRLRDAGYTFVMVSNQDGLGTSSFPYPTFKESHEFLRDLLASQGVHFEQEFICPHFASDGCTCPEGRWPDGMTSMATTFASRRRTVAKCRHSQSSA